jgi:hypothetical protein
MSGGLSRRRFLQAAISACVVAPRALAADRDQGWADRRVYGPFVCTSAFPLGRLEGVFLELAQLESELHRTLAIPPARQTVDVFLLADEAAHRTFLAQLYPHVPYRRALYVRRGGRGAVYAYQHDELAIDLRHESTHALLHATLPDVPLWLDEGLAEYFEMSQEERAYGHPHLAVLRWNYRLGMSRTMEMLEARQEVGEMGSIEYRFAWSWVHFMLHGPAAAHRTLVNYLADIRRGESAGQLSVRLRRTIPDLDERMARHIGSWRQSPSPSLAESSANSLRS